MDTKKTVTVSEAADIVGVNPRTILKRIEDGRLVAERIGQRVFLVDLASVEEYASTVCSRSKRKIAEAAASKSKARRSARAK